MAKGCYYKVATWLTLLAAKMRRAARMRVRRDCMLNAYVAVLRLAGILMQIKAFLHLK